MHQQSQQENIILGTAIIRIVTREGGELITRALCDNGSQVNLITTTIIQKLREKPVANQTSFIGIGGNELGSSMGEVTLTIKLEDDRCMVGKFYVVKAITNYSPNSQSKIWKSLTDRLADPNYNQPGRIHVLLGVSSWIQIIKPGIFRSQDGTSIAQETRLGYVVFENSTDPYQQERPYIGAIAKGQSLNKLMEIIQRLWQTEEVPKLQKRTKEEELCEEIFALQHSRDEYGRYTVKLPFNDQIHKLGKSKMMALKQFFAMERKMKQNQEFGEKYKIFMSEYETLGHMEPIWEKEESGYYTPHHGVLSSGKFRVVFNASAKSSSGVTLNETQMTGEKLQRDLVEILMNFRQFKFGITADIEKMYRQIWVHKEHRKFQKILWRDNPEEPVKIYELKTITYGHTCAPHCAIRTLIQCAEDHKAEYPRGARIVKEDFYVDDLLTGADTELGVMEIKTEVTNLLKNGGMNITKWKTNGKARETVEFSDGEEQSVLGLCWNLATDKFFYKLRDLEITEGAWTKRKILSRIGKMYDPSGFLGPVIIRGKMLIQELWKNELDWDEAVTGTLKTDWTRFNEDLGNVNLITTNRWLGIKEGLDVELHGFCDASEKGYGAAVYSRVKIGETYQTEIIASKSKVAPLKAITIPRLELCSANLLANLLKMILPTFEKDGRNLNLTCWSDSQIVLLWLTKPSANLKTYVANRVANIQTISEERNIKWKWIASEDNPADLISRGTSMMELSMASKWWNGPSWFNSAEKDWPKQPEIQGKKPSDQLTEEILRETKAAARTIHLTLLTQNELIRGAWFMSKQGDPPNTSLLLDTYGEWKKLLSVTTTIFRAAARFGNIKGKSITRIKGNPETLARDYLIRKDQERSFSNEINAAKTKNREALARLVLIWDNENEFLRIDGRVRSENLTRDEQFPILLSKTGVLAQLLIRDAHYGNGHAATQWILQYLRKKYWIIGARKLTKAIISKCPTCFKLRMGTSNQLMAALPTFRTTPQKPFFETGVDYAGPVTVRASLGRAPKLAKAWIAVFVCLVTRAIHLELVSDATTQAFIAALKRLIARRGRVAALISDNGTNFVGANNYLKAICQELEKDVGTIEHQCQLKWRFTTPGAPHQGGIYEAAVKSTKYHLTRIIGDTTLTFEEYATILSQVEAMVNSRPIAPLNDDPTSLNALTPGHFLIGEALVRIPDEEDFRGIPVNRLSRWNHLQQMTQYFWERWHEEYVTGLINRSKWRVEQRNFKVGDLVIIREDNVPPLRWKLGKIEEVIEGKDKLVRSVVIRTKTGVVKRPIVKIGLFLENE